MISAAESNGEPLGLFIFDIDHFKIYNDTNGHLAGDELLKSISKLIRNSLRPGDLAARYGGEEFVIAMPGASQDVAFQVANRLRETIEHNAFAHAHHQPSGKLTISGGVASYSDDAKSVTELISHADQALYQAKASGRNKVRRYQPIEFGNVNINYSDNLPKTKKGSTGKP